MAALVPTKVKVTSYKGYGKDVARTTPRIILATAPACSIGDWISMWDENGDGLGNAGAPTMSKAVNNYESIDNPKAIALGNYQAGAKSRRFLVVSHWEDVSLSVIRQLDATKEYYATLIIEFGCTLVAGSTYTLSGSGKMEAYARPTSSPDWSTIPLAIVGYAISSTQMLVNPGDIINYSCNLPWS